MLSITPQRLTQFASALATWHLCLYDWNTVYNIKGVCNFQGGLLFPKKSQTSECVISKGLRFTATPAHQPGYPPSPAALTLPGSRSVTFVRGGPGLSWSGAAGTEATRRALLDYTARAGYCSLKSLPRLNYTLGKLDLESWNATFLNSLNYVSDLIY